MKASILSWALITCLIMASTPANAGGKGHHGHAGMHGHSHHGHSMHRHRYGHPRPRYGHQSHHHTHSHPTLAGGILLGTFVTTVERPRPAGVVVTGPAYGIRQPYAVHQNVWYQRDFHGDCFKVKLTRDGRQVWTQARQRHCR